MPTRMDLELVKFINSGVTWNSVKKGHRSMVRRPRRTEASSSEFGFDSGNKMQDSAVFDYEKSGVAILGQHFAEEVLDVPIKKRILLLQTPSLHHQESELPLNSKHASGSTKMTEKELPDLNDFSGIELLAAAACDSSAYDNPGYVKSSAMKEHTTPEVASYPDGVKRDISPMNSDDSSVQDSAFPATENLCEGNDEEDIRPASSKDVRFHWDLNTVMDEWEEPCDILVDPHSEKSYPKDVYADGLQNAKANLEGDEQGSILSEMHDASISVLPLSKPEIFGIQGNNDGDCLGKTYDAESCASKSDVVDSFTHPSKCEHVSTSTASVSLGETATKVESDDRHAVSEVVQGKGDSDDKLTSEDHLSDCCVSNVSHDERGHMAEENTIDKVKLGYDSPVEDGELREPTWQKEELEERECVDYESDNIYEDNFDTIESVTYEIPLDDHQTIGVPKNEVKEDGGKADVWGSKTCEYHLQEHSQSVTLEEKDSSSKKFPHEKNIEHDEFPRRNSLCIDRSTLISFGASRNAASIRRSRSDYIEDSYLRAERDFGQEKLLPRSSGQWSDSFSGSSQGYPRLKNVRSGGSSNFDNNQATNYNRRDIYRTFNTRPSPSDRNEYCGIIHQGAPPARGLRRTPQESYNDREPYFSERKIPSFSSNYNRGAHDSRPRRRSRSRSRSGSPIAWHFQKKRIVDAKRQSPDQRSDTRCPFRKPSEIEVRVSPQSVCRSFDDRNMINRVYRDRRSSPVRTFHRDQRIDPPRYPGDSKSNDHFRPARFPPNRERFEANSNYNSIHDKCGMMNERRRFRYDVDESLKGYNSRSKDNGFRYVRDENRCFRESVGKDIIPENTSQEKSCRYTTTNKMFNTGGHFHKDN